MRRERGLVAGRVAGQARGIKARGLDGGARTAKQGVAGVEPARAGGEVELAGDRSFGIDVCAVDLDLCRIVQRGDRPDRRTNLVVADVVVETGDVQPEVVVEELAL